MRWYKFFCFFFRLVVVYQGPSKPLLTPANLPFNGINTKSLKKATKNSNSTQLDTKRNNFTTTFYHTYDDDNDNGKEQPTMATKASEICCTDVWWWFSSRICGMAWPSRGYQLKLGRIWSTPTFILLRDCKVRKSKKKKKTSEVTPKNTHQSDWVTAAPASNTTHTRTKHNNDWRRTDDDNGGDEWRWWWRRRLRRRQRWQWRRLWRLLFSVCMDERHCCCS